MQSESFTISKPIYTRLSSCKVEEFNLCRPPEKKVVQGARGKIVDVVYTIHPSREFVTEVKASSKRQSLAEDGRQLVDNSGAGQGG